LLDSWIKNFIWSGDVLTKKVFTRLINKALILKLSWDLIAQEAQWSTLFKRRYFSNGQLSMRYFKSSVWSGIKIHIGTVLSNSLWIVGTGNNIHFWTDNWLGEPLVDLLNISADFHGQLTGMVSEVIVDGTWIMPAAIADFGDIQQRLESLIIPCTQLMDVLAWKYALDGHLTLKLACSFLRPQAPVLPWAASIWSAAIPPSHSFIYWRLYHRKMPTDNIFCSRGCVVVSVCSLCMKTDESSDHLFLHCDFASRLWDWIGDKLHCVIDYSSVASLLDCRPARCSSQVSDIFLAAILHTIHTIWWARNAVRFSNMTPSFHSAKVRIHSLIASSGNISKGKCLHSDFDFLDSFAVKHNCRNVKDIISVLWKAPSSPWLKVNTDGSVIGGQAACGGLFRDYLGTFRGAFYCNIGIQTVFYAEVLGIILAIEYAAQQGWRNIWLESDSTSALLIFF